ncbi:MAG TPA: cell wall hydrolase [Candidatus Merdenecus merdavium]|nr:cell wall hydrolase [Candidatus Merdenecus merdavium]
MQRTWKDFFIINRSWKKKRNRVTKAKFQLITCLVLALLGVVVTLSGFKGLIGVGKDRVYATPDVTLEENSHQIQESNVWNEGPYLELSGLIDSVKGVAKYSNSRKDFQVENAFEQVLVGTSVANKEAIAKISVSQSLRTTTNDLSKYAEELVAENQMSQRDYEALLHIVEAEATGEGLLGKILVANVVLNRVDNPHFPDSIYDVVWEKSNGIPQFSPTVDGRINTIPITDETIEAVNHAINGEDYSQGALFFSARAQADPENMLWFDGELQFLFNRKNHDFYTLAEK